MGVTGSGFMQEGELLEMGSHPELIAKQGVYSEMWARQVSRSCPAAPADLSWVQMN